MRHVKDSPDQPASAVRPAFIVTGSGRRAQRRNDALGLDCLARTLDQATLNIGLLTLNAAEQAALQTGPRAAADAMRGLAEQVAGQLEGLEVALAEVIPARR